MFTMRLIHKYLSIFAVSYSIFISISPVTRANTISKQSQGMVVSAHSLASEAGINILQKGGNAVDAAVATAFAISVVEPFSAGIGGGGFLLLRSAQTGEIKALDFREWAPRLARRNMFLDSQGKPRLDASKNGYLAVGVPGTVAGLYEVHRRYGKISWSEVIEPAIKLADRGFAVSEFFILEIQKHEKQILNNPATKAIFTRNGKAYNSGELLIQTDLANTLKSIAKDPQNFYTGNIAKAIAADMAKNNGIITLEDLKSYRPTWRSPLCDNFRQYRICSMPPPSSGGVHLLEILHIIGNTDIKSWGRYNPDTLHLMIEAMRIAYADRSQYLGDPKFVQVPVNALTNAKYGQYRHQQIDMKKAAPFQKLQPVDAETLKRFSPGKESTDTSHLTVVDNQKNVVSLTFTINGRFGASVTVPGTGILLNNEMDDFAIAPNVPNLFGLVGGDANSIAPGKIPLSSMTPIIVTENDKLRLAGGSPGGSTIITTMVQIILNILVDNMDAKAAVKAPRLHHQWLPDKLLVEKNGFDAATLTELRRRGHEIVEMKSWGNANVIVVTSDGVLEGAADPRGEGKSIGF